MPREHAAKTRGSEVTPEMEEDSDSEKRWLKHYVAC